MSKVLQNLLSFDNPKLLFVTSDNAPNPRPAARPVINILTDIQTNSVKKLA